jgi:hypothetical protein
VTFLLAIQEIATAPPDTAGKFHDILLASIIIIGGLITLLAKWGLSRLDKIQEQNEDLEEQHGEVKEHLLDLHTKVDKFMANNAEEHKIIFRHMGWSRIEEKENEE